MRISEKHASIRLYVADLLYYSADMAGFSLSLAAIQASLALFSRVDVGSTEGIGTKPLYVLIALGFRISN